MQYFYTIRLLDMVTGPLQRVAQAGATAYNRMAGAGTAAFNQVRTAGTAAYGSLADSQRAWMKQQEKAKKDTLDIGRYLKGYIGLEGAKSFFSLGNQVTQTSVAFETMLGSAEKGNALFEQIRAFRAPYMKKDLADAASTMIGFGVAQERVMPSLKMIADVARGDSQRLNLLTLAFSQMTAAGKLMGQDLLQFINAGFNPLKIISEQTGKSIGVLRKEMENGAISSDMVAEAFRIATSEGGQFYGMSNKMANTLGGKWTKMVGDFQMYIGRLSAETSGAFMTVVDAGIAVVAWMSEHNELIKAAVVIVGSMVAAYWTWIGATKVWIGLQTAWNAVKVMSIFLTQGWTAAQLALNGAMWANPIGIIIALIAGLVVGIIWAWNKFEGFRMVILGVWGAIKQIGVTFGTFLLDMITAPIKALGLLGDAFLKFVKGDWKGALSTAKDAALTFTGVTAAQKAVENGKKIGEAYANGAQQGVEKAAEVTAKAMRPKTMQEQEYIRSKTAGYLGILSPLDGGMGLGTGAGATSGKGTGKDVLAGDGKTKNGITGITEGGSKQTNVNISGVKLIENLTLHAQNVKEGSSQIRDILQEELLRLLNSANLVAHGS